MNNRTKVNYLPLSSNLQASWLIFIVTEVAIMPLEKKGTYPPHPAGNTASYNDNWPIEMFLLLQVW